MPRRLDLAGQRFNRWLVESYAGSSRWNCLCDCGNRKTVLGGSLTKGLSSSCGCLKRELTGARLRADLVGRRFGRLVVVKHAGSDKHHKAQWECQCDCGSSILVGTGDLLSGKQKACRCSKRVSGRCVKDETGNVYGKLTVLRQWGTTHKSRARWLCQCSCGNQAVKTGDYLRNGDTKSCGCDVIEKARILGQTIGKYNKTEDNYAVFSSDRDYAERIAYIYFVEVEYMIDKIGIAFNIENRSKGAYTKVWYSRPTQRAVAWAAEQVVLRMTAHARPSALPPLERLRDGYSELRQGLALDETIELIDGLVDDAERLGWQAFWAQHHQEG